MKRIRQTSNQNLISEKQHPDLQDETSFRTDPFLIPGNYFDDLPQRIMERVSADSQHKLENPQPSTLLRRVWLSAAAVAAIAVVFMMIKPSTTDPVRNSPVTNNIIAPGISDEYDQTYSDEALLLEENEITDKDVASIDYKSMGIALNNTDTTSITTEEIIQYLLDENCDTELIAGL